MISLPFETWSTSPSYRCLDVRVSLGTLSTRGRDDDVVVFAVVHWAELVTLAAAVAFSDTEGRSAACRRRRPRGPREEGRLRRVVLREVGGSERRLVGVRDVCVRRTPGNGGSRRDGRDCCRRSEMIIFDSSGGAMEG